MLPTRYLEKFLQYAPRDYQEIVLELRNIVACVAPAATEKVLWNGLCYYDGRRGGPVSGGICMVSVEADHVCLGFVHGAFLPDPEGLLEGARKAKRFLRIRSYEAAPWDYIKELITSSYNFDPRTIK